MTDEKPDTSEEEDDQNHMREAVRLRQERRRRWQEEGERPLWMNLSMVGALGWLIVVPTLLGVAIGRWIDHAFGTGITFTGALIFIGVAVGGSLAWRRINSE
ncbi:MAG: AtpZ/AtpI family protein [Pseudomonadales bacterium]